MKLEFKSFEKIERIDRRHMVITQKIHGSNAQIIVYTDEKGQATVQAGSRTRFITPGDDNYGFAAWVEINKAEIIEKLGPGIHFGEWAGPGINSGEGLTEKTFVLFDFWKYPEGRPLPPQTRAVPVLYSGAGDFSKIEEVMTGLRTNGSRLAPGFMRPEGVVITLGGTRYKKVFEVEETQWTQSGKPKAEKLPGQDWGHLLQPIRLEKLLSKEERYIREFPKSLPEVVRAYFEDLTAEGEIEGDEDILKAIRKSSSSQVFNFIRKTMETMPCVSAT